jgi:hypothetical protein
MIIAEAIKQQQTCSISFDSISSENACVTTCGHVFSKESIKEWLKQNSTCPECRKPCRINGEAAAAPPPRSGSARPPFGFGFIANPFGLAAEAFPPQFQAGAVQPQQPSLYFGNPNQPMFGNGPASSAVQLHPGFFGFTDGRQQPPAGSF